MPPPLDLRLGDVLRLRKEHPCGSFDFEVVRLGADIGLRCTGCGRRILLPRSTLGRRIGQFMKRGPSHELPPDMGPAPSIDATPERAARQDKSSLRKVAPPDEPSPKQVAPPDKASSP